MTRNSSRNELEHRQSTQSTRPANYSNKRYNRSRRMQPDPQNEVETKLRPLNNSNHSKTYIARGTNSPDKIRSSKSNEFSPRSSYIYQNEPLSDPDISKGNIKAAAYMAAWCFDVLISAIQKNRYTPLPPSRLERLARANVKCPIFVTWLKKSHKPGYDKTSEGNKDEETEDLRGCIGCLSPIPILKMKDYAILSGLKDQRFRPISLDEIDSLTCKLSFLTNFEICDHIYDWEIGVHGIIINFESSTGRKYSSTFLPEVALEHKMNHKTAIDKLIRKSDYSGLIDDNLLKNIKVTRYQSSIVSLPYHQYKSQFKPTI